MNIYLHLQARSSFDAQYLVSMGRMLRTVTVPTVRSRKHRLNEYRHAINKALRLNSAQYRWVRNERMNGQWVQVWRIK
jgi:hypothetical protein